MQSILQHHRRMQQPLSPRFRFGLKFSLLGRRWRRLIDSQLAKAGLTDATWVPLVHLKETGGGISQKELAARVGVDGSSLVRVLDILEREDLIERRRDQTDGRARLIHLTASGELRLGRIRQALSRAEEEILVDISDAEILRMLELFQIIDRRMTLLDAGMRADATPEPAPAPAPAPDAGATTNTGAPE